MKFQFILSGAILVIAILVHPAGATPLGTPGTHGLDFAFTFTNVPAPAQAAATKAAHRISNLLTVGTGIANQTIDVTLEHANLGAGVLGDASPVYSTDTSHNTAPGFLRRVVPNEKAVTGVDTNGTAPDVVIRMTNEAETFSYTDPIGPDDFDYETIIVHEITHSMGFVESITEDGDDGLNGLTTPGNFSVWDQYIGDSTGVLIDGTTFMTDAARWNTAKVGGTGAVPPNGNGLYFYGPNAVAANGGNPIPLFSANPWVEGSSGGGHMDSQFYGELQRIMNHARPSGPDKRAFSPEELGMMVDIGYRAVVIPEPSTAILMLFAACAAFVRRRKGTEI